MKLPDPDYYTVHDLQVRWNCSETTLYSLILQEHLQPLVPIFRLHYSNENAYAYCDVPADQPEADAQLRKFIHEASKKNIQCEADEILGPDPLHDRIEKLFQPATAEWIATHSQSEIAARTLFSNSDVEQFEQEQGIADARRIENKQEIQCEAIIEALQELGFDPVRLPNTRGHSGPKRRARDHVLKNKRLFSDNSFDKAWDRLRSHKRIKNC